MWKSTHNLVQIRRWAEELKLWTLLILRDGFLLRRDLRGWGILIWLIGRCGRGFRDRLVIASLELNRATLTNARLPLRFQVRFRPFIVAGCNLRKRQTLHLTAIR